MSELEKLEAGLEYSLEDAEVATRKAEGVAACARLAAADQSDAEGYEATARSILAEAGPGLDIQPGFRCDWGKNIHVDDNFTANYNVTIFDIAPVTIGDGCDVWPGSDHLGRHAPRRCNKASGPHSPGEARHHRQ